MKFSLLSFNTQGTPFFSPDLTLRYKKFCELINKDGPDIICFEEITNYYNLFLLKKYLKNYPHFIYKPFFHAPKGGLVIVSKIPLTDVQFVSFVRNESFRDMSFMAHVIKNGMLMARIKDTDLTIINAHTFTDFEFDWSPENQLYRFVKVQIEQVAAEVNRLVDKGQSVILTGDLNSKKNSRLYKYVLSETKMTDVFAKESISTYFIDRLDYKFKGKISARIDIVFLKDLTKKINVLSYAHLFNEKYKLANKKQSYLSDHIGLKVNFDIV